MHKIYKIHFLVFFFLICQVLEAMGNGAQELLNKS